MSARGKVWSIGLLFTMILIGSLGWDVTTRELSIPVGLLSLAICALIAEAAALRSLARGDARASPPEGALPADGFVELVPIAGVEAVANSVRPECHRFVRVADGATGPESAGGLSRVNPPLLGRVVLFSVFVGRDGGRWTDREIARGLEAVERAGLWIEREAIRRTARVNIGLASTYFQVEDDAVDPVEIAFSPEGDDVGPMEANASTKAVIWASRAAARLGFADVGDLIGRINPLVDSDARVWLFHLRRVGRSMAIPAADCDLSGVGLAICHAREASFPEPLVGSGRVDPTTVAHEVLHLFGASDKYGVVIRSFPTGSVTARDIMRLDQDSLSRSTIDRLTALEIGWTRPANPKSKPSTKKNRR